MATCTPDRRSGGYNIQWYEGTRRRTIHLGGSQYKKTTADRLQEVVEKLLFCKRNGIIPDKATETWLKTAPDELKTKLSKVGLIIVTAPKTCKELWDGCLESKTGEIKNQTLDVYRRCQRIFHETFSETESIGAITEARLKGWKTAMLEEYAESSVSTYLTVTRMVFEWAKGKKWLEDNPMKDVPLGNPVNRENDHTMTMEEYAKLLEASPNQEWRTIIALARIGGLRCPSELQRLRWTDVNWSGNRFTVYPPKTERYEIHRVRIVPLFSELREELQKHFDDSVDNEFVIQHYQGMSWQLGGPFKTSADRVGLEIPRPFDSMRTTRSNEVVREFGAVMESLWIGHSIQVMKKFYLQPSDDDFAKAAGNG
jgi:integrase